MMSTFGRFVLAGLVFSQLFVTFRPGAGAAGEVSYTGGYPFADGSTVQVTIDGTNYEMFTQGEWAWPATPDADAQILAAMQRGADAAASPPR